MLDILDLMSDNYHCKLKLIDEGCYVLFHGSNEHEHEISANQHQLLVLKSNLAKTLSAINKEIKKC